MENIKNKIASRFRRERRMFPFKFGKIFRFNISTFFKGTHLSYVPDRYSDYLPKYNSSFQQFYNEQDKQKWTYHNYTNNAGDLTRFYFLNLVMDQLLQEGLKYDVAELGVYKGNSAFLLAKFAQAINKKAYLFDTYEGFEKRDLTGVDANFKEHHFNDTSLEHVKTVVGFDSAEYVKGYFPESLSQIDGDNLQFCLVHIDCDLEKPFISSLNYFYPRLVEGGFLIMHDYSSLSWDGAPKAINEFFKDKKEKLIPIPDKSGTVVIRKIG